MSFGSRDYVSWALWITHIRLDRKGIDAIGALQRRSKLRTRLGRGIGRVSQNERRTFRGEITGNGSANSFMLRLSS